MASPIMICGRRYLETLKDLEDNSVANLGPWIKEPEPMLSLLKE